MIRRALDGVALAIELVEWAVSGVQALRARRRLKRLQARKRVAARDADLMRRFQRKGPRS
jgi:hypothetical protein